MPTRKRKTKRKNRGSVSLKLDPVKDKALFDWIEQQRENEANISALIRQGLQIVMLADLPTEREPVDAATLRTELGNMMEALLARIPAIAVGAGRGVVNPREFIDVNDKGRNIPDF